MKTAVSIPDPVFDAAERLARRLRTSRSRLYARALAEFIARNDPDQVTRSYDRVMDAVGEDVDGFVGAASSRRLRQVEW
jgi:hypothetical protein